MKLTTVELTAADESMSSEMPAGIEARFLLARQARQWATVADYYGSDDRAWARAVELCRAGLVTMTCTVVATRLGPPTRWHWTELARSRAETERQRVATAEDAARRLLSGDDAPPAWVDRWLGESSKAGLLAPSASDSDSLLLAAASCLAALSFSPERPIGRGELAARHGGARGAHALDDGHRLAALVLRGAAAATGAPYPRNAAERRALWSSVGVSCDTVSATVIVANLRPEGKELLARQLVERADARLPTHLTARDLVTTQLQLRGTAVHVCENPWVLEAALDGGVNAALVCTAGNPTTVSIDFLCQLRGGGARIFYRGDFDWPGIAIANRMIERVGCGTWLFDTGVYLSAVQEAGTDVVPLTGKAVTAGWSDSLSQVMETQGVAIHEELLVETLVAHLAEVPE